MAPTVAQLLSVAGPAVFAEKGIKAPDSIHVYEMPNGTVRVGTILHATIELSIEELVQAQTEVERITLTSRTLERLADKIKEFLR